MNSIEAISGIPEEIKAQLRQTLDDLVKGIRRPDKMKTACERMDRMREQNRRLFGDQNIAVDLIREARNRSRNTLSTAAWPSSGFFPKPTPSRQSVCATNTGMVLKNWSRQTSFHPRLPMALLLQSGKKGFDRANPQSS